MEQEIVTLKAWQRLLYGLLGCALTTGGLLGAYLIFSYIMSNRMQYADGIYLGFSTITFAFLFILTTAFTIPYYITSRCKNVQEGIKIFLYQLFFSLVISFILITITSTSVR